jgi:hypothetical protein
MEGEHTGESVDVDAACVRALAAYKDFLTLSKGAAAPRHLHPETSQSRVREAATNIARLLEKGRLDSRFLFLLTALAAGANMPRIPPIESRHEVSRLRCRVSRRKRTMSSLCSSTASHHGRQEEAAPTNNASIAEEYRNLPRLRQGGNRHPVPHVTGNGVVPQG